LGTECLPLWAQKFCLLKKEIKLVKKSYCFTCATEKNWWASLKKSDCSTRAAEKCSTGASETCSAGAPGKKNQTGEKIVLLHLCHWKKSADATEKLDCSTSTSETHSAGVAEKNQTVEIAKMASNFPDFGLRCCTWFCTSASYMFGIQTVPQLDWKVSHNAHSMQECQGMACAYE